MSGSRTFLPLSGSHRFDTLFREGTRVRRGGITIVAAPGKPGPPRVGLVAGRRVGGAVTRNRAKRRMRAALDRLEIVEGHDYAVVASPQVCEAPFEMVLGWVRDAMAAATDERAAATDADANETA